LIHDLKNANKDADIAVKLVSKTGIGTIASGVAKAFAPYLHFSNRESIALNLQLNKYHGVVVEK
jgi:hypothetical protein